MISRSGEKLPDRITLAHGNGGLHTRRLIEGLFLEAYGNGELSRLGDGALLRLRGDRLVITTDSHVIQPIFFPGSDIGALSIYGTVNDLVVSGALPEHLTASFIIEEGFPTADLKTVVDSMARAAEECRVTIVTGDTKVVEKGSADGLFINTTGVGTLVPHPPTGLDTVQEGDAVILSGTVGDHGMALYSVREEINFITDLKSDCASLLPLGERILTKPGRVRFMRDPTRGGVATVLNEFVEKGEFGIVVEQKEVPLREEVRGFCELLGFDPLYIANEGKLILIAPAEEAEEIVHDMRSHPLGERAAIIGRVTAQMPGLVRLKTEIGGERLLDMLTGEMLPRIC